MAYLDGHLDTDSIQAFTVGDWMPDLDVERWKRRGTGFPLRSAWTKESGPSAEQIAQFDALPETAKLSYAELLGRDVASAQREQFFYANALEQLKGDLKDENADAVVDRLQQLGFSSIKLPEAIGGPPPQQSPRPFRKVLDWLLRQLAKVGRLLLNAAAVLTTNLHAFGLSAIAVNLALPPGLGVELPVNLFRDAAIWPRAKRFLDSYIDEIGESVFNQD